MPTTAHPDAFHFERPVASWWEATTAPLGFATPPLTGEVETEVAIIGAGFTGLSAALHLAGLGIDVCLLEAGTPGWGASGRNGGFCSTGAAKLPWPAMVRRYGLGEAKRFYECQLEAVETVQELCARHAIEADLDVGGEIALAHSPGRVAGLAEDQRFLAEVLGKSSRLLDRAALQALGCDSPAFHGGLESTIGASLNPLAYVRGLARAAATAGARIQGRSEVVRWREEASGHVLETRGGGRLRARHVLVATNGFTPEHVSRRHAGRIMPALSAILVTRPLSLDERAAQGWTSRRMAYDTRRLLHYFRLLPDGRFLFGGRGGVDASDAAHAGLEQRLRRNFERLFPAWSHVEHTHFWKGFVCLAYDLVPYVGALDDRASVWTALCFHGNGVAMGTWSGRAVAELIACRLGVGTREPRPLPAVLTRRLARFPLPALRPLYLRGAYLWYGFRDATG